MKHLRLILPLALALGLTTAQAAIDCSTLTASAAGTVGYRQQGSTDVTPLNLLQKPTKTTLCGVKIDSDRNSYSFQAKDIASLSKLFDGQGMKWPLMLATQTSIGGTPSMVQAANLSVTFPPDAPKGIRIGGSFDGSLSPRSEIVVRANGGKLQTLLKDINFTPLYFDAKSTKKIELYVKSPDQLTWTRLLFDVPNAKMTFFRTSTYPSK